MSVGVIEKAVFTVNRKNQKKNSISGRAFFWKTNYIFVSSLVIVLEIGVK